jgi:hypothetical protein
MAVKEVIETECDECSATETHPTHKMQRNTLPVKWIHVRAINWQGTEVFARDLCPGCAKPLAKA